MIYSCHNSLGHFLKFIYKYEIILKCTFINIHFCLFANVFDNLYHFQAKFFTT